MASNVLQLYNHRKTYKATEEYLSYTSIDVYTQFALVYPFSEVQPSHLGMVEEPFRVNMERRS